MKFKPKFKFGDKVMWKGKECVVIGVPDWWGLGYTQKEQIYRVAKKGHFFGIGNLISPFAFGYVKESEIKLII